MSEHIEDPRPLCRETECDRPAVLLVDGLALCGVHALARYYAKAKARGAA